LIAIVGSALKVKSWGRHDIVDLGVQTWLSAGNGTMYIVASQILSVGER
jgi:hypothetical protein